MSGQDDRPRPTRLDPAVLGNVFGIFALDLAKRLDYDPAPTDDADPDDELVSAAARR
ncbi:MAG: hypothetical protein QOE51_1595 [Actinoplanes sp.]|jgi:hypothetical protein|nr:hypothetical protein [Actinoplanes sp.]